MANRTKRTKEGDEKFLDGLRSGLSVSHAAKSISVGRRTVYEWRDEDEEFKEAWEDAIEEGTDAIEDEAFRRAVEGVEKPVGFYRGVASERVNDYSDSLLVVILKARRPEKYRERFESVNRNLNSNAQLDEEDRAIMERFKNGNGDQ